MTATTDDRRLPPDAFTPPDAEALETGRRFPPPPGLFGTVATVHGLLVAYDRAGAVVTPLAARGPAWRASRPSYPGSTSRVLGEIDAAVLGAELYDAAWRDNARLRRERDAARADCVLERTRRQDAQVRLATAEMQRDAAQAELDAARDRIAELVLTLRALGEASDPAGHDNESGATAATKERQ